MPKVIYVSAKGEPREVDVPAGMTVMAAALKNGIDGIVAECGGVCMCSTCHVFVDEKFFAKLPPAQDTEEAVLEIAEALVVFLSIAYDSLANRVPYVRVGPSIPLRIDAYLANEGTQDFREKVPIQCDIFIRRIRENDKSLVHKRSKIR